MNVERRTPTDEMRITRRFRKQYPPLKIVNGWGKIVEESTNTIDKRLEGMGGMLEVAVLSAFANPDVAIPIAFTMAVLGGATIGEKIPLVSWLPDLMKEKKAVKIVREKENVSPEEIANVLYEFPDVVTKEEVKLWPKKRLGEESLEHPERYQIMKAVLTNNPESPDMVVDKFMEAQKLAQENRRSEKNMRKDALTKGINVGAGVVGMAVITYLASYKWGFDHQAGVVGLFDDVILFGVLGYSFAKNKINSFFSKYQ